MRLIEKAGGIFDHILRGLFVFACVGLAFVALSMTVDVVARYFFLRPIRGLGEVNMYLLVYMTFLSAAWLQKQGRHISMETFAMRLPPKGQLILNIILAIVGSLLWLVITWYSGQATWTLYQEKERAFSTLNPLTAFIVIVIPVGGFLLSIELIRGTCRLWMRRGGALPDRYKPG